MEASRPSLGVRATGLVKQLFLSKRLKRLSTFEPLYGLHVVGLDLGPHYQIDISVSVTCYTSKATRLVREEP